jgi:hypothetical protein
MKYSKRTILMAALATTLTVGGVAAAYSDIQLVPAPAKVQAPEHWKPVVQPTIEETPVSDTADNTSTEPTPLTDTPKQTNNEVTPNEPAIQVPAVVEYDPTPEPLPAPDTNITNVANPNSVLGNDTAGTVSNN